MLRYARSPKFPIFLIVFVDVVGLGITLPVLPLFAQSEFRLSALQIGGLTSLFFLAQFFAAPVLGRLSDRIGRRPVLVGSQLGTFTGALITATAGSPLHLIVARIVDGLTGGNISVAQAYITDISPPQDRARSLGLVFAAFGMGFLVGPAFGAYVSHAFGPRVTFACAAAASLVTMLLSYFVLPESLTDERRRAIAAEAAEHEEDRHPLQIPAVRRILAINFTGQVAAFAVNQTFILWARDVVAPEWSVERLQEAMSVVFVIAGLAAIVSQRSLIGPLVARYGEAASIAIGSALRVLGYALMGFLPRVVPATVGAALTSVGQGIAMPCASAFLTLVTRGIPRGQVIGLSQSSLAAGNILGPLLGGLAFDWNPKAPPFVAAAILCVTLVLSLGLGPAQAPRENGAPPNV